MPDITDFTGVAAGPRTEAQVLAIIEKIDLAIYNLLHEDKNAAVSYRIGDRSVDRDGYLLWLLDARKTYERLLAAMPQWAAAVYDDPDV